MSRVAGSRRKYLKDPSPSPPSLTSCSLDFTTPYPRNFRCAREWRNRVRPSYRVASLRVASRRARVAFRYDRPTWKDRFLTGGSPTQSERSAERKKKREEERAYEFAAVSVYQDHVVDSILPLLPPVLREER